MDPAKLLDILGNENRRKIIQLLANRPCYVSEISGRLGVGPKAIISHLNLLEQAGLIECSVDEQRRKYFNIANNMRLEVSVSPYSYTVALHDIALDREKKGEPPVAEKKESYCQRRVIFFLSETEQQTSGTENKAGRTCTDAAAAPGRVY